MRHYIAPIIIIAIFLLLVSVCGCRPPSISPTATVSPKIVAKDIGEIKQDIKQIQTTITNYSLDAERAKNERYRMVRDGRIAIAAFLALAGFGIVLLFLDSPADGAKSAMGVLIGLGVMIIGPLVVMLWPW